jgi:hypothetical protein
MRRIGVPADWPIRMNCACLRVQRGGFRALPTFPVIWVGPIHGPQGIWGVN